ncbi:hypothetical protein [Kosakonia radicincitans]|uniref:hypothetical protein n=1 Tax=Kosakonia radicincitans TaxID=283686 RepID=UPI0005C2E7FE|nr:hypothetical protein [Kosakonia radicincitans]KIS41619.1 hypothetical protein LG58_2587 [Kosakonia radicincitans YD4]
MSTQKVNLSGAATDVIHALFFRGALQDGDLPSKTGVSELRELGFVETRHTATEFKGANYFTFLTPAGIAYARQLLVDTRFGASKKNERELIIKIAIDVTPCLEQLEALKTAIEATVKNTGSRQV